ncbi:MAG: hypothetical protein IJ935_07280 [Afipia sp.]|nr:hypothetical protein [Afipia sp.]
MARQTLRYEFEELPAFIDQGFECGQLDGIAEISYASDGEWFIRDIGLVGARKNKHTLEQRLAAIQSGVHLPIYDRKLMWLDSGTPIFSMVYDVLDGAWNDKLSEAVAEQIAKDRESAADDHADYIRERRREPA